MSKMKQCFKLDCLSGADYCILSRMKRQLTAKQIFSVPCPTCGVSPGTPCERYSGAPRRQPHVDRRFVATEALVQETETVHAGPSRKSKPVDRNVPASNASTNTKSKRHSVSALQPEI